jgi:tetratricopeptide (TPR) repeat protein
MAAVLTRRLRRPVTVDRLGFDCDLSIGLTYPGTPDETIEVTAKLWDLSVQHATVLATALYTSDAAVQTALAWRYDPDDPDWARTGPRTVTAVDVEALNLYATHFADLDRRGGGAAQVRTLGAEFLHRQVGPMLRATYTDSVGRALMGAAAGLAGQLAYMAYDAGEHGAALRHYTTALRLSRAAGDRLYGAHLLANLATQAVYLGHPRNAVRLAAAALDGAGRAPATVLARLHTAAACAYAVAGDRRSCTKALGDAQEAIGRALPGAGPIWSNYFSPAHFAGTAARCYRDLRLHREALAHGPAALHLPADSSRTRALHTALLATIHVGNGDLEEACRYGDQAVPHLRAVRSQRVRSRLTELTDRLRPYRREAVVADFFNRQYDLIAAT